jgi:hypothetical protein
MSWPFFIAFPTTNEIPERIYIPIVFLQITFLFFILMPFVWHKIHLHLKLKNQLLFSSFKNVTFVSSIFFVFFFTFIQNQGSVGLLISEINSGQIFAYHKFIENRYKILINAMNSSDKYKIVCVDMISDFPESFFCDQDIENDRTNSKWNRYYEAYFKIDELRVFGDNHNKFINFYEK